MTAARARLAPGVRLAPDPVTGGHALLYPEGVMLLNETGAAVLARCGDRSAEVAAIAAELAAEYDAVRIEEITDFLSRLAARRLVVLEDGDGGRG